MRIEVASLKKVLLSIANRLKDNEKALCLLDSNIGDGDHGLGMARIAGLMADACNNGGHTEIEPLLSDMGIEIMSSVGGSSGALWGSFFCGFAEGAAGAAAIDADIIKQMMTSAVSEMRSISKAEIGDKTMMDAILPAAAAAANAEGDLTDVLSAMATAAKAGADATSNYMAKYGRAKNLHERAIGYKDAGAVSAALVFDELASAAGRLVDGSNN